MDKLRQTDWIKQVGFDWVSYGVVTEVRKNGKIRAAVFTSYGGSTAGKAKWDFIQHWYPGAVKIDRPEDEVPPKIMKKIDDKAGIKGTHAGI